MVDKQYYQAVCNRRQCCTTFLALFGHCTIYC